MKLPLLLAFLSTTPFTHVIGLGFGCSGCLSQSLDLIREGCYIQCGSAFASTSSEYKICRTGCNDFVVNQNCCQNTCSNDINSCLIPPLQAAPSAISQTKRDFVHISSRHAKEENQSANPQYPVTILRRQIDIGKVCCRFFGTIYGGGAANLVNSLLRTQTFASEEIAALALLAFGAAGTTACYKVYGISCLPVALTLQGSSLFPLVPPPPPPPRAPGRVRRSWIESEHVSGSLG